MSQIGPGEAFGASCLPFWGREVLDQMASGLSTELETCMGSWVEAWTNKPRMRERWNTLARPPRVFIALEV